MNRRIRFSIFSLVTLWVVLISLVMPLAAFADDGVPPTDAEQAPTEEAPVGETSDGSEVTASETSTSNDNLPTQESAATEAQACEGEACPVPTEEAAPAEEPAPTEEPLVLESATLEMEGSLSDAPALEDVTVAEVLESAPEGTEVIVLDENSDALALVSEVATQVVASGDPTWCPDGHMPGEPVCTGSFSTFTGPNGLLAYLLANKAAYWGPGTIYVEQNYDTSGEPAGSIAINYLEGYGLTDLTIQGGWDGILFPLVSNITGTTTFDKGMQITWLQSVTLNDLIFTSSSTPSPESVAISSIFESISLDNVEANNNASGYGAILNAYDSVTINDSSFNDNQSGGLYILSRGEVSLSDITASSNNGLGVYILNDYITGHNVTLDGGAFNGNGLNGLTVVAAGDVSLTDISAVGNGGHGVYVDTSGNIIIDPSSFNGNTLDGAFLVSPNSSSIYCSEFKNNGDYGVDASNVDGMLTLNDVTFSGNTSGDINPGPGTTVTETGGCPPSSGGGEDGRDGGGGGGGSSLPPSGGSLPVDIIPVTGSDSSATLDCVLFNGTTLALPSGNSLTFMCPTSGEAGIASLDEDNLPGNLPEGSEFVSGIEGSLENGDTPPLPGEVVISFVIPDGKEGEDFAVLFWNGSEWEELDGFLTADGHFQATTDQIGVFVLVTK